MAASVAVMSSAGSRVVSAAARAGASAALIAAVGDDAFGASTRAGLASDAIDTALVRTVDRPTGTALIAVDDSGENTIIVEAGANAALVGLTDADAVAIAGATVLVMQLEIPLETVIAAALLARSADTTVVLNAAPIRDLPDELLAAVDVLVVNEHEAARLAQGRDIATLAPAVIVTLGAAGARLHDADGETVVPAPSVVAVDATGAGDTFCGVLAALVAEGAPLGLAVRHAVAAASLSVQSAGAVPSIPWRAAIDAALN
jgi:ribokinase